MSIIEQLKALNLRPYKDTFRITQGFGGNFERYGQYGHTGVDIGENNTFGGDPLYAPLTGTVLRAKNWNGDKIGWEFQMESDEIIIDGKRAVLRINFLHTRGQSQFKNGDRVMKGNVVDISGGRFTVNGFWTGPHTHIETQPRYWVENLKTYQPEWQNGHAGFIDPMAILPDKQTNKPIMKQVLYQDTQGNSAIYLLGADTMYHHIAHEGFIHSIYGGWANVEIKKVDIKPEQVGSQIGEYSWIVGTLRKIFTK